ncbi:MAG: cytochrome c3 family protein [Myxococcota bacterium]
MKKAVVVTLFIVAFLVTGTIFAAGKVADELVLKAKNGDITFKHKVHVETLAKEDKKCDTCHHTSKPDGADAVKCSICHTGKERVDKGKKIITMKDAAHKKCKDCHETMKAKHPKAPGKQCKDCHVKKEEKK